MPVSEQVDAAKQNGTAFAWLGPLASLKLTVAGLGLLLVLTVWGTLYQVNYGLFQAQERFFRSWYFMAGGFLPFPGGQLVMAVLFANLVAAGLLLTLRKRMRLGLFLTHGGLFLMLGAGAVTFYMGEESHLSMVEGESSSVSESWHFWEVAVWTDAAQDYRDVAALDTQGLKAGMRVNYPGDVFALEVEHCYPNSDASGSPPEGTTSTYLNASGVRQLTPRARAKEPTQELPGVALIVREGAEERARLLLWGGDRGPTAVELGGKVYQFELRRRKTPIPATIQLVDFRKVMHPGSEIARSYSSQVMVRTEHGPERKVLISMNKPLRLDNFTFYQSSYQILANGQEISTLAVVKNYGRTMPYVATGVTVLGMILHFAGRLVLNARRAREKLAAA